MNKKTLFILSSILVGFLVGAIIFKMIKISPLEAYSIMFQAIFSKATYFAYAIIKATPLILTGLSVAFAFRTGLFNIGAEGQFIMGTVAAGWAGYYFHSNPWIQIPFILLLSLLVSGLWGGLAGFFKARFGVHEVISTIMLNWIAFYFHNFIVMLEGIHKPDTETTFPIELTGSMTFFEDWKYSDAGVNYLSSHPFLSDFLRAPVNAGIIFAILCTIIISLLLKKTTLGLSLKAVGFNKDASHYNGIDVKKNMVTSMFIAGALSGLAGSLHVLGLSHNLSILAAMEGYGFDGIAVALIGASAPFGVLLSGFFLGALKYSGAKLQSTLEAPSEVISIIIGVIIFFAALPKLFEILHSKFKKKVEEK